MKTLQATAWFISRCVDCHTLRSSLLGRFDVFSHDEYRRFSGFLGPGSAGGQPAFTAAVLASHLYTVSVCAFARILLVYPSNKTDRYVLLGGLL